MDTTEEQAVKEETNKLNYTKIKTNCVRGCNSENATQEMGEKITNLIKLSRIHKELWQLNKEKLTFKMGKGSEQTFLQRRYPKPPKEHKRSVSLIIREIQIKTTI